MKEKGETMRNLRFENTMTKCGTPLWVLSMPSVKSAAVGVIVHAGTRDEMWPREAGIAHATEHMVFQGNTRLPDSRSVAAEIEAVGGGLNAWTSKETTFYYRIVPANKFSVAVRSLGSQLNDSLFAPNKITPEMQNIVQEIRRAHDAPDSWCRDLFDNIAYGTHPLSKDTLGTEEAVKSFGTDDFKTFMRRLYYPANYSFVVVGNISLKEAEREFDEMFQITDTRVRHLRPNKHLYQDTSRAKVFERDIKQAHVCMGVTLGKSQNPGTTKLLFYKTMVDGGMSFPLYQEVRDKRGLCYAIEADVAPFSDYSLFQIYVGTDPKRIKEAIDCIHEVIEKTYKDEKLFLHAKTAILGGMDIAFENTIMVLQQATHDIVRLGDPRSPDDIRAAIETMELKDVAYEVEKYLLDRTRYAYAYVVPNGTTAPL